LKPIAFTSLRRLPVVAVAALLFVLVAPGSASAAPPPNDNFANAETITDRFGWVEGDNTEATKEPGEPDHAGNPGGASVWYSWTAPSSGRATLTLCYAEFDSLLAVYVGDDVTQLQQVAADDNGCGDQSWLTFAASAGVTYRIAVDGADGAIGYFELGWGIGPANDDFAAANELPGDSGQVAGDNRYASLEPGEPEHGPSGSASVWYRWTAPSSGPATFELCDSYFDTMVAVYTGSAPTGSRGSRRTTTTVRTSTAHACRSRPRPARSTESPWTVRTVTGATSRSVGAGRSSLPSTTGRRRFWAARSTAPG
jgi:hypothetical protein